ADHYRDAVGSGEVSGARFWLRALADEAKALPRARLVALWEAARGWARAGVAPSGEQRSGAPRVAVRLRSSWYLYLLALLLLPVVATLYGQRQATSYESTATIYVQTNAFLKDFQPQDANPFATKAQNVSDQMSQLLQSE